MPDEENDPEINREAIREAISAPGDHACRNDPGSMCPVKAVISNQFMLVDNKKNALCPNYTPFGYSGFCNSYIRKSIYDRYRV